VPLFIIERNYADQLQLDNGVVEGVQEVNGDVGVSWIYSFLSADKRKTYCLYEASDPELIREAARRNGLPADVVMEVTQVRPETYV
jgi:hypothetical protein